MEPVPVAEKLLKTKLFGFSLQRLIQSFAVPMAPGLTLTVLNFPALIFGPTVIVGGIIGAAVYIRTPPGQSPAAWLFGMIKYYLGPDRFRWKPIQYEDNDVRLQEGEGDFLLPPPEQNQESEAMFGNENTIENLDFESIHDSGVIETEEAYSLIIEIEARPWLILDGQSRQAVYQSFSQFLMGIKAPIQIFTLPVPFDAGEYVDSLKETNHETPPNESELLEHGRVQHANWLENVVEMGEIRDRRHFLVVTAQKHEVDEQASGGGFLSKLKPSGGDVDQKKRYDELWTRAENVTSALPRTGTQTNIVDSREEVLEVLYYYYKGSSAPGNMDHGWLTKAPTSEEYGEVDTEAII
ncbi:hypothetical protein [Halosimplex pelagicum]|jgi:hypothetical protein|uniref:TraC-like domain-containing protein n=1 Tax=Halosimplex pelagicum TaxID=869886 RepID=A0A7D5TSQ9_9EURY|nr:hypothetical protein [Halosimplex pelagicum]QLH82172.1 hypothetical protein HZS54_11390 [Halosimplex pelagicum]